MAVVLLAVVLQQYGQNVSLMFNTLTLALMGKFWHLLNNKKFKLAY